MKKSFFVSAFLVFLLFCSSIFASPADVEKLSGPDYFSALHNALSSAKESVFVVIYYAEYKKTPRDSSGLATCSDVPEEQNNKVCTLLSDLVSAKERGVSVKVILDRNTIFKRNKHGTKKMEIDGKNMPAFYFLKRHGIDVKFDTLDIYTHGKCVVIDGETVILGSHNWTETSLTKSNDYSVLIKSREFAQGLLSDFSKIKIDYEASNIEAEEYVEMSEDVLRNILSGFVSRSDNYAFNVYLYLVGSATETPTPATSATAGKDLALHSELEFDYKKVAEYLGLDKKMSEEDYRQMLGYQTLKRLQDKYGLLEYASERGQNGKVSLKNQTGEKFEIPKKFWEYGWDRRLSLSAQFCYFINLIEGGPTHKPWSMSKENLIKKYKVGKERFSEGMSELRHWNLLDIEYGGTDSGKNYSNRMPNRYRLKDLYRIEDFNAELKKLYSKYGKEKIESSREYAKIIFCENNLADVEEIARMMDEYGEERVGWAFGKVGEKSEDNPKRTLAYIIGILKN